jgi:hypothetical protein
MLKINKTTIPIYDIPLYVIFFDDEDELRKKFKLEDIIDCFTFEGMTFEHYNYSDYVICVAFNLNSVTKESINTITHESYHVVDFLVNAIKGSKEKGSEEYLAYLFGFINGRIYRYFVDM